MTCHFFVQSIYTIILNGRYSFHIHQSTMLCEKQNFPIAFTTFKNRNCLMPVKHYTSVAGFVTSFIIVIAFFITFSSPTMCGFIWMVIINTQNYRVWSFTNPRVHWEVSLHPLKVRVWYAMSRWRIIGPIFVGSTITTEIYRRIITDFIVLLKHNVVNGWFQQETMYICILRKQPCNFFHHFLLIDWFLLVCGLPTVQTCPLWTSICEAMLRTWYSKLPLPLLTNSEHESTKKQTNRQ